MGRRVDGRQNRLVPLKRTRELGGMGRWAEMAGHRWRARRDFAHPHERHMPPPPKRRRFTLLASDFTSCALLAASIASASRCDCAQKSFSRSAFIAA